MDKEQEAIEVKQGCNFVNVGVELILRYKEDENRRSNGNPLKIYNNAADVVN